MNGTRIVTIAVVIIVLGGAAYLLTRPSAQPTSEMPVPGVDGVQETVVEEEKIDENAAVFNITGKNFEFSQDTIEVKKGQTVTINFTSEDGLHDWTLDDFNAATSQVNTGDSSSVTFVADKVGEFEYYCSIGNHRKMGMVGTLTVTQ